MTYLEVKTVSGLSQWYHSPVREDRAVMKRDKAIKKEYETAAKKADQWYFNTDCGSITQRLVQFSLPLSGGWEKLETQYINWSQ